MLTRAAAPPGRAARSFAIGRGVVWAIQAFGAPLVVSKFA